MMRRTAQFIAPLAACAALALAACPAAGAITAPNAIGSTIDTTGSASRVLTTTADAPAGVPIVVAISIGASSAWTCSDSAGNSYTQAQALTWNATNHLVLFYIANPLHLVSGGTITCSWAGGSPKSVMAAISAPGLLTASVLDVNGTASPVTGTGTTNSAATGTLGQADELVLGVGGIASSTGAYTTAPGFQPLYAISSTLSLIWDYQIVNSTGSVTWTPSWITSRAYGLNVYGFKGTASAAPARKGLMLLGVGQ